MSFASRLLPYIKLMRLDKPIGIWLLMFPGFWGVALGFHEFAQRNIVGTGHILELIKYLGLFFVGAVVMRSAGCIVNDLWDRKIDAGVARTKTRPLPAGDIGKFQAFILLGILLLTGLLILLQFNWLTILLGAFSLVLVALYPLMKRITWWPQAFLGLTFNWGILMGSAAITGQLSLPAFTLYIAAIFWTLGYDTIYAAQDVEDDLKIGVKSTAIKFSPHIKRFVALSYSLFVFGLYCTGVLAGLHWLYYAGIVIVAVHSVWQLAYWNPKDTASSLRIFKSNQWVGAIGFLSVLMSLFLIL